MRGFESFRWKRTCGCHALVPIYVWLPNTSTMPNHHNRFFGQDVEFESNCNFDLYRYKNKRSYHSSAERVNLCIWSIHDLLHQWINLFPKDRLWILMEDFTQQRQSILLVRYDFHFCIFIKGVHKFL